MEKAWPADVAMKAFLGTPSKSGVPQSMAERIEKGRKLLMAITHRDFGYDALRWHDYLWETGAGGYRQRRRSYEKWTSHVKSRTEIPEWRAAVSELQHGQSS